MGHISHNSEAFREDFSVLNSREVKVSHLLLQHFTNEEIAKTIHYSPSTVKVVVRSIRSKLGVDSRRDIARLASHFPRASDPPSKPDPHNEDQNLADLWTSLSPKEQQVARAISLASYATETEARIAELLGIAPSTLKKHLQHIYRKLNVQNRTGAALIAVKMADAMKRLERRESGSVVI